jgi:hypothetical protein
VRSKVVCLATLVAGLAGKADAGDAQLEGLIDAGLAVASRDKSFIDGGLGKYRYGGSGHDGTVKGEIAQGALVGTALVSDALSSYAHLRWDPDQKTAIDLIESYLRYRPVSQTRWRWSVTAGAFFPPVSLENTGPGWSAAWTLTPSAINSWIGEELRTLGGEGTLEWRGDEDQIGVTASLFALNDPAGALIANRGWALTSRVAGLFDRTRLPDTGNPEYGPVKRHRIDLFKEIDNRPGFYGGLSWHRDDLATIKLLRYDNQANPSAYRGQFAWRTDFWSLGAQTSEGRMVFLTQAMTGSTEINPVPLTHSVTEFQSAYVLAGYDVGQWRLAGRVEAFATGQRVSGVNNHGGEHGHALTVAATWRPFDYLHFIAEASRTKSWRVQRVAHDLPPAATDTLVQVTARFLF